MRKERKKETEGEFLKRMKKSKKLVKRNYRPTAIFAAVAAAALVFLTVSDERFANERRAKTDW